jgi:hypothetical protein
MTDLCRVLLSVYMSRAVATTVYWHMAQIVSKSEDELDTFFSQR